MHVDKLLTHGSAARKAELEAKAAQSAEGSASTSAAPAAPEPTPGEFPELISSDNGIH